MTGTPEAVVAELERTVAALRKALDTCQAERDAAWEQQAGASEVLRTINASHGNLAPVFNTMLERAVRLCDAAHGVLVLKEGDNARTVGSVNMPDPFLEFMQRNQLPMTEESFLGRAMRNGTVIHVEDVVEGEPYRAGVPHAVATVELGGVRSMLMVPMVADDKVLGLFTIYRQVVQPFTGKQIALLETFAAQAVIAMENARLLGELQTRTAELAERNDAFAERIGHQAATIDVLKEMSASPGDAQPVFDLICDRARALTGSMVVALFEYDGELIHFRSNAGIQGAGGTTAYTAYSSGFPRAPDRGSPAGRAILDKVMCHVRNVPAEPGISQAVRDLRYGTQVSIPLLRDGRVIGALSTGSTRVDDISETQIELLETFAEQAVIAITSAETWRALRTRTADLQQSLEYQTATTDVLKMISRSTFDLQPVLRMVAETAARLCRADQAAICRRDGDMMYLAANFGFPAEYETAYAELGQFRIDPHSTMAIHRAVVERRAVHIPDAQAVPGYAERVLKLGKVRTALSVPLLREGDPIGGIALARQRLEPFTPQQIDLVRTFADQAVIAIENTRLLTEQREALERQTATAEVLQVINASPGDLAPVFDAILEKAHALCGATLGTLQLYQDDWVNVVAIRGAPAALELILRHGWPYPVNAAIPMDVVSHVDDSVEVLARNPDSAVLRAIVEIGQVRTQLHVPLRKDGVVIGRIAAARREVRPFTSNEISLLENFAAQAVIAMENARLLGELRERTADLSRSLEQQTAMADVLAVINANPGELAPVFDTILEKAHVLCGSAIGHLALYENGGFRRIAYRGLSADTSSMLFEASNTSGPRYRLVQGERFVHAPDLAHPAEPLSEAVMALREKEGIRSFLLVPMRRDGALLGYISANWTEPRADVSNELSLLENFAAQAVIAMENARLLTEQREALARQTATADVLRIINESPGDLAPVFDAILEKALNLSESTFGLVYTFDGKALTPAAMRNLPPAFEEWSRDPGRWSKPMDITERSRTIFVDRLILGEDVVHVTDITDDDAYRARAPQRVALADLGGARSALAVALRKDDVLLGEILLYRQEVRAYAADQIDLVKSFAAQAVIAMENARLLTEQREALEQQTASAEILTVISTSMGDMQPVFDKILMTCKRLFDGDELFVGRVDEQGLLHLAAYVGRFREAMEASFPAPLDIAAAGLAIREQRMVHYPAIASNPDTPSAIRRLSVVAGYHSGALAPMIWQNKGIGVIGVGSSRRSFTERQLQVLQSFADQAVIAIQNTRLLTEQREALEQQTATAEILRVINANPGETTPVFHAILENSLALAESAFGAIWLFDREFMHAAATRGMTQALSAFNAQNPIQRISTSARHAIETGRSVQLADMRDGEAYRSGHPASRAFGDLGGARANLVVPLIKEREAIGCIHIFRQEIRPFSDKQIALLEGFAAQAVIAMENARLLAEQAEALERQTAVAEVLQVINRSPGDLVPVFNAMLERAFRLCDAEAGALWVMEGEIVTVGAFGGFSDAVSAFLSQPFIPGPETGIGRLMAGQNLVQIADLGKAPGYLAGEPMHRLAVDNDGLHSLTAVPLRKDGVFLGAFGMMRRQPGHFTDKQISLLRDFAAQAVIAMENARLLNEIRRRQGELDVTFQSMGDGVALFDETHHLAAWNQNFQDLIEVSTDIVSARPGFNDYIQYLADRGEYGPEPGDTVRGLLAQAGRHVAFERTRPNGRVIRIRTNPTPAGGFVVMYTDITESKRAEDALRAARDAAENALRDLKIAQANLVQAEKMASLGQLTAGIAHEIKNPLNFVNNFAALSVDLLNELKETAAPGFAALTEDQRADIDDVSAMLTTNLQKITEHGKRADGIVRAMLEHSRGSSGERREVDLNGLVEKALNLAYHGARAQDQSFNITLERNYAGGIAPIEVNPQDLTRVFLNLFSNGFYAANKRARDGTNPGYEPTLRVSTTDHGDGVEVRVRDNGTGIPPDIRDKLFQPFFTTKPTGEGTGLGLSITYDIVTKQHGGSITVDSAPNAFSEFTVTLPRRMFDRVESTP